MTECGRMKSNLELQDHKWHYIETYKKCKSSCPNKKDDMSLACNQSWTEHHETYFYFCCADCGETKEVLKKEK